MDGVSRLKIANTAPPAVPGIPARPAHKPEVLAESDRGDVEPSAPGAPALPGHVETRLLLVGQGGREQIPRRETHRGPSGRGTEPLDPALEATPITRVLDLQAVDDAADPLEGDHGVDNPIDLLRCRDGAGQSDDTVFDRDHDAVPPLVQNLLQV